MGPITSHLDGLSRLLDVADLRHRVLAHNVANVNTPGYRRLEVTFEDALAQRLAQGDPRAALAIKPEVVEGRGGIERVDGNNVDLDIEMGHLNKNTLLFRTLAQVLAVKLAALRSAISGR
jgi:flagellar basal-body rod protein FlgB